MSDIMKLIESAVDIGQAESIFLFSIFDAEELLKAARSAPEPALYDASILHRSGIILTVASWETFIEEALRIALHIQLVRATSPSCIRHCFNRVSGTAIQNGFKKPEELEAWTGEGWKRVLHEHFAREINTLHSPNSENISRLSRYILGFDLTSRWSWNGVSIDQAKIQLDELFELRCEIAHRTAGVDIFVDAPKLAAAIDLTKELVSSSMREITTHLKQAA